MDVYNYCISFITLNQFLALNFKTKYYVDNISTSTEMTLFIFYPK
jgi:hypothetical protein